MPASRTLSPDVDMALRGARKAWERCCADYNAYAMNSERCLQAAFYFHLRTALQKAGYTIYIEAKVIVPPSADGRIVKGASPPKARNIFIDTLVCKDNKIVLAIERKRAVKSS